MNKIRYFILQFLYLIVLLGYIDVASKEFFYLQVVTVIGLTFMSLNIIFNLILINHSSLEKLNKIEEAISNDFEDILSILSLILLLIIFLFVLSMPDINNTYLSVSILILIGVRLLTKVAIPIYGIVAIMNARKKIWKTKKGNYGFSLKKRLESVK